jgi:phosphatidate cytidylyltransferase
MTLIISCIVLFILLGGLGMFVANKKTDGRTAGARWLKFITYILIVLVVICCILLRIFYIPACVIVCFSMIEIGRTISFNQKVSLVASLFYIIIASAFLFFAFRTTYVLQFFLYFQVLTFDAFCQVTGQLAGKRIISSKISPSKTWEGLAGGFIFCILSSVAAADFVGVTILISIALGLISGITAFTGDMLASWYKRKTGIKDYSNFLPGQGGFLDRFDSLMVVSGFYVLLYILTVDFIQSYFIK